MATACKQCNGMGFIEKGEPSPTCGTPPEDARHTFEVAQAVANRRPPAKTIEGVDGPVDPSKADEVGTDAAGAGFSAAAIAAQEQKDLAAMARER